MEDTCILIRGKTGTWFTDVGQKTIEWENIYGTVLSSDFDAFFPSPCCPFKLRGFLKYPLSVIVKETSFTQSSTARNLINFSEKFLLWGNGNVT